MDNALIILSGLIYTNKVMYKQAYKLAHYLKNNVTIKTLQVIGDKDLVDNDTLIFLNCKMKLELRNWDKGACPFIPIRATAGPLFSIFL